MNAPDEKRLTVVVGAGASTDFDLPTGTELKTRIAEALDLASDKGGSGGDALIIEALHSVTNNDAERVLVFARAAWRIRDAMPQAISIDNFIDQHRDNKEIAFCAKLAIAKCILDAEKRSPLRTDKTEVAAVFSDERSQASWLNALFQLITQNCPGSDLRSRFRRVAIICFNYDRCIEQYFYFALQNYYGFSPLEASDTLAALEIHHPYGTVGSLPWQARANQIAFGASPTLDQLLAIAQQLRTFTEGTDPKSSDIEATREALRAQRIVFLGFAYHLLNIKLLWPQEISPAVTKTRAIYGTAFGISASNAKLIESALSTHAGVNPRKNVDANGVIDFSTNVYLRTDLKCAELLRDYWWSLPL